MSFFKNIIIIFIITISFINNTVTAQTETQINKQEKKPKVDTTRIKDLSDKLSIWIYSIRKLYELKITNLQSANTLFLSPNDQTNIGFGFNYKWMGIGFAFKPPWAKNDNDIYGNTSRFDFQLNIFSKSFGLDFSLQYYKGYYLSNPNDYLDWDKPEYPQLNDLETASLELSGYYFTNHRKFSYRAAFVRNEIQKRSAGSLILGGYVRYDIASAPHTFIPEEIPEEYKDTFNINAYISGNAGFTFGYTYTFVFWKKFFLNLSLAPGFGIKAMTVYTSENKFKAKPGISGRVIFRTALGYEHKYFYLGLSSISISNTFSYENIEVSASTTKFRLFVGKRFNVNKKKEPKTEL